MLLSIGLMVKNEAKHLEKCLRSLVPILETLDSELIVVDTGSTDNTVEIAKIFTDKVYYHEWNNDFSEMRNKVLSYAKGEWFFFLDGDEVLDDAQGVIDFFKSKRYTKFNSAFIEIRNQLTTANQAQYASFHALRFFRKEKDFCFVGIIHEQPQAKGPAAKIEGRIIHYGYINDDKELMEYKFRRNVELIEQVLSKEPDNIYHLFQLSQSYAMYGRFKEALGPIQKAYKLARKKGLHRHMNVINHLANVYFGNQMFVECEAVCEEGIRIRDGYVDLYFFKAMSQAELGKFRESITTFKKYLSLLDAYEQGKGQIDLSLIHVTVGNREHVYATLCGIYRRLGYYQQALDCAHKVTSPNLVTKLVYDVVDIHYKQGDIQAIREFYDKWLHDEKLITAIEGAVESKRIVMDKVEKLELSRLFAELDTTYGFLNVVRNYCTERVDMISPDVWQRIEEIGLSNREAYYGDFLVLFINYGRSIVDLLSSVRSDEITRYFMYLFRTHKDFLETFKTYIVDDNVWKTKEDFSQVYRIKTAALYALLLQDTLLGEDYKNFFKLYLEVGIKYVEACYNPRILDIGDTSWARTGADGFLFKMRKALNMEKTSAEYIQYLREALVIDPSIKKGIELLLQDVQEKLVSPEQREFSSLKKQVQGAIENAISSGDLQTAKSLIQEYEEIVGLDARICSAKGIIFMMEGRFDRAREIFLTGLELDPNNADILYNFGYLYEITEKPTRALRYYTQAWNAANNDESLRNDVQSAISRIWNETIPSFRRREFEKRVLWARTAQPQKLVQGEPKDNIHVVYTMAHVGVTGGAKVIFEHANRLQEMGLKITIVCHFPRPDWFPLKVDYIEVPFEEKLSSGIPECDVIVATYWDHIHECIEANIAPVVYFEQGDFHLFDDSQMSQEVREFVRTQYSLPQFIITVSNQTARVIEKKFGRTAKVFPNSVDDRIFNNSGRKFMHPKPYIVMIGNPDLAFKGINDIVESYSLLKSKLSASEPEIDLFLITPVQPVSVPDAVCRVFVNPPQAQISELLRGALMYVSGSYYESFSLPPMEAMACGCPVITTANIGVLEYAVEHFNALLCEIGNPKQLAEAMFKLITDEDLRSKLIDNGLKTVEKYKWANIIPQLAAYYREVACWDIAKHEQNRTRTMRRKRPKVSLVYTSVSGSNTIALYKHVPKRILEHLDVHLVCQTTNKEFVETIASSDVVVITEGNYHFNKADLNPNQVVIDLWHGFPLKTIGYANKNEQYMDVIPRIWENIDIIGSYSPLNSELMARCFPSAMSKCIVLGAPRNDFLFETDGRALLNAVLGIPQDKRIIFYLPTWRRALHRNKSDGSRSWDNIFGMDSFDNQRLQRFLADNNSVLITKLHPVEQAFVNVQGLAHNNIYLLTDHVLLKHGMDFYELLNGTEILITDYSSVFFDFLLLDRPIIFTPTDIESYMATRGFLLEPYDDWTPGDKALNQAELEEAIFSALNNPIKYQDRREKIRSLVHYYNDGNSSERVWNLIEELTLQSNNR